MKTYLLIFPLAGAAWLASAAEPVKPEASNAPTAATTMSVSKDTTSDAKVENRQAADKAATVKLNQRIDRAASLSAKAQRPARRAFLEAFNPLAPVEPQPETRWLSRSAWATAAPSAAGSMTPVEVRHEPRFDVVVVSR